MPSTPQSHAAASDREEAIRSHRWLRIFPIWTVSPAIKAEMVERCRGPRQLEISGDPLYRRPPPCIITSPPVLSSKSLPLSYHISQAAEQGCMEAYEERLESLRVSEARPRYYPPPKLTSYTYVVSLIQREVIVCVKQPPLLSPVSTDCPSTAAKADRADFL